MPKYSKLLIIQFPYNKSTTPEDNLSFRHELEDVLDAALRRNNSGEVDGGEIGPGGINIWVYLDAWKHGIPVVHAYLKHRKLLNKVVISKKISDDKWEVVWPKNYGKPFNLLGPDSNEYSN